MSKVIKFEVVDNDYNILRIGGKSLLPEKMEWPVNPNGENKCEVVNEELWSKSVFKTMI